MFVIILAILIVCSPAQCFKKSVRVKLEAAHDRWLDEQEETRRGRTLLQADVAAAPAGEPASAPAGPPLPLPENALEVCDRDTVRKATKCKGAKEIFVDLKEEIDEECCKQLSFYFSNASKQPTRNCWCDPDVWARELERELISYITLGTFFDTCVSSGYTTGDDAVNYFQDGAGPCAGMPVVAAAEPATETAATPAKRSFGKWVREALPDNPWLMFSFIVSIPSVLGFSLILWPFIFHFVMTAVELPGKLAAKKTA